MRLFLVASGTTAIVGLAVAVSRNLNEPPPAEEPPRMETPLSTGQPIAAEAGVFRTTAAMLAIEPGSAIRRAAHPRTLATFHALRSYPGAPPRIPHGLTPQEIQSGGCKTCHERGGFSQRFGAYVPITPHPELGACLQCHVGDAKLMAISLPNTDPSARCSQCHATGGALGWTDSTIDWKRPAWPALPPIRRGMAPPPIPHDLEMRTNCLSCHGAPFAVDEITTSHPERANCRQCHLTANGGGAPFERPPRGAVGRGGTP
ncbi:MAG TPA: hypothetical protein VFO55_05900 [Gemmatimonadaceae bacterium]|nr:hypothetical protein [Gemmatimonadaceae bacterium]